ncbi:MAG: toprim domain-containing protein [Euryarchaeota archaeon]|nr:toprim domain-containing protein [Euryarchaeota archaeon]MBU4492731.1 toprim domain-containing protein [Euryarchaeota archaeon]MCG2727328.1 toprim domain-containing protein [Candidatus Methanoperedenaceae archaeon]
MNSATLEDLERLERLEELIVELQTLADSGAIIVVEGRKDTESLRFLGIKGEISLASQQPLLEFAELLSRSRKEIVLLTDWDKKGGIVARKIIHHLLTFGIMPNTDIRSRIRALTKKRIKDIESLNSYVNKLRYELHGVTRF